MTENNKISAVLIALACGVVALFWPTFFDLHTRWTDLSDSYTYGYLVPLMAIYMLRERLARSAPYSHAIYGLQKELIMRVMAGTCAIVASVAWAAGFLSYTGVVAQIALPAIYFSLAVVVLSRDIIRPLIIPALFFYFAVPMWEVLSDPLRTMAVFVVERLLLLTNVPALVSGYNIQLASGVIAVDGGCSGLNTLMTSLVIGTFYAFTFLQGTVRWVGLLLIIVLTIFANWIRIFSLVIIGHKSEMSHPLMQDHSTFGWLIYAVALLTYFLVMHSLEKRLPSTSKRAPEAVNKFSGKLSGKYFIIAGFFILAISIVSVASRLQQDKSIEHHAGLILGHELWFAEESSWAPDYSGFDEMQSWRYGSFTGINLTLLSLNYYSQEPGKELIQNVNQLATSGIRWLPIVQTNKGTELMHVILDQRGGPKHLYFLYRVGQRYTVNTLIAKLYQAFAEMQGDGRAALLIFSATCVLECSAMPGSEILEKIESAIGQIEWKK